MLNRDQIAERLAESEHECFPPPSWGMYCEALETAQKLGEWLDLLAPPMPTSVEWQHKWRAAMLAYMKWSVRGRDSD